MTALKAYEVELSWTVVQTYEVTGADEDEAIMQAVKQARRWDDATDSVSVEGVAEIVRYER